MHLQETAYIPDNRMDELIEFFGVHMHDHVAAIADNLSDDGIKSLDRSAYQDELSAESVEILKKYSWGEAMKLLKAVYAKAAVLHKYDQQSDSNNFRFRIGVYSYSGNDQQ